MGLKPEVTQAFSFLGITPDTEYSEAAKAYKKLALKYHPDKNTETNTTAQFQEVGSAWNICQRHYEQPELSQDNPFPSYGGGGSFYPPGAGVYFNGGSFSFFSAAPPGYHGGYSDEDDEDYEEEFYRYMFESVLRGRYSYASGQKYREQHPRHHHTSEQSGTQKKPQDRQKKEKEEYEQRLKQFEKELEEDAAREREEAAQKERSERSIQDARARVFQAARRGDGEEMKRIIELFDLDVTLPRTGSTKGRTNYETLLHLASSSSACRVSTLVYLVDKGASPSIRNGAGLTPFHSAVLKGNVRAVKWYLGLSPEDPGLKVKNKDGCHPGKVVGGLNGYESKTPLDLAMESGSLDCVELMVKYATVHKVEAVWNSLSSSGGEAEGIEKVRKALLTKNGFVPPPSSPDTYDSALSRKEQERLEKQERVRIAEENRQKKEERRRLARLRDEEEAEKQKAIALVEEQERKERLVAERQKKAEEERDWRMKEEQRVRREAEQRAKRDAEVQEQDKRREHEAYVKREKERLWQEEQEKVRKQERIKEEKRKREEELRRKQEDEQERERRIRDELEKKIRAEMELEMQFKLQQEREKLQAAAPLPISPSSTVPTPAPSMQAPVPTSKKATRAPRLCRHYQRGYCKYKDRCRDLHQMPANVEAPSPESDVELRSQQQTPEPRIASPAPPTPIAASAPSLASELPSPITETTQKSTGKVCRFYARGKKCMYGSRCRNLHVLSVPSTSDPSMPTAPKLSKGSTPPKKLKTYLPSPTPSPGPEDIQTIPLVDDELFPVQRRSRPAPAPAPVFAPSTPTLEPTVTVSDPPTTPKATTSAPPKRMRPPRTRPPVAEGEEGASTGDAPKKSRSSRKPFWMRKKATATA